MPTRFRVAVLLQSPIDYTAGLMRHLARAVDLHVYYCADFGAVKPMYMKEFGTVVKWDRDILEGFEHSFLTNFSPFEKRELNPGIVRELSIGKYDAVIVRGYVNFTSWLSFLAAHLMKIPIIMIGETDLLRPSTRWKKLFKRKLLRSLFEHIDAFLYSCSANAEYYKYYGASTDKLFFVPSAVDNDLYQERAVLLRERAGEYRGRLKISDSATVLLSVSKLIARKRPLDILKAFEGIQEESVLIFVGDGPLRPSMEAFVWEHNMNDRVRFVGFKNRTEIDEFYAMSDIFVLASAWDPSPKALQEAMNFSLPVIVSDQVGTAVDLVAPSKNGFIFPTGDWRALQDSIERLVQDPVLRKESGAASLAIVSEWNYQKGVEGILEALRYVTKSKKEAGYHETS